MSPGRTGPVTPTVDHDSLALGRQLGQGGQGSVHEVLNRRINESSGGGWEVVHKEYSAAVLPHLDAAALAAGVGLLGELSGAEGRWLCDRTAWPAAVVQRQGRTCGFLMRAVPDRFQFNLRTLTGVNGGPRRLANMEYLLNNDTYIAGIGLTVSDKDRLLLLADLAATLARLHRLGITVGDLSPRNLLFSVSPQPECFLIDCDAMRLRGATALPQAETPDWQVPAGEELATPTSDVYKLGLLAVRLFARNQTSTDTAALAAMSPALGALARASLDHDPARRPTPAAWAEQLTSAAATAPTRPARKRGRTSGAATPAAPPTRPGTGRPGGTTPAPKSPTAKAGGVLGALAAVVVLILLVVNNQHSSQADASGGTGGGRQTARYTPGPLYTRTTPTPTRTRTETTPDPVRTTLDPPTPTPTDAIGTAHVGDCFDDNGTNGHADLSTTSCTAGAFKVVRINSDTTDLNSCDNVPESDRSVSSSRHDLVLCLSYQSSGGTAYHARQGDCVFGAAGSSAWGTQACQTGNFKVLAVYRGTSDKSKCDPWPHYNYWRFMPVGADSRLDVLLCLSMNYPDDAGYATVKECLSKSGSTFTNVGSCNASNVYVTGRTSTPNNPSFCGKDGSTYWRSADYPAFGYTVCWRWR